MSSARRLTGHFEGSGQPAGGPPAVCANVESYFRTNRFDWQTCRRTRGSHGGAMPSYAPYCPVAKATETLGDRWMVLIVREMLGGASGFNELQRGLPRISRSVLADRMRTLERAKVIERRTGPKGRTLEYLLTPAGRDLQPVVQAIGEWGATWSLTEPRPEELDPYLLTVWMARHVDRQRVPSNRTVIQFDFRAPKQRYWMVLEPSEVSVCLQHPGFDVDLQVVVDTATLYRIYLGRADLGAAIERCVVSG